MGSSGLDTQIQLIALALTLLIFGVILELVRRRRLVERYALLWMVAGLALVVLAVWRDLLEFGADLLGIAYPPNALFIVAFAVAFILLLHFSVATSRLSEETKILAQEVARLDGEVRAMRSGTSNGEGPGTGTEGTEPRRDGADQARDPSSASTTDQ